MGNTPQLGLCTSPGRLVLCPMRSLLPLSPLLALGCTSRNKKARGQGQRVGSSPCWAWAWPPKELEVNPAGGHLRHTLLSPPLRGGKIKGGLRTGHSLQPTSGPGHLSQAQDSQALPCGGP